MHVISTAYNMFLLYTISNILEDLCTSPWKLQFMGRTFTFRLWLSSQGGNEIMVLPHNISYQHCARNYSDSNWSNSRYNDPDTQVTEVFTTTQWLHCYKVIKFSTHTTSTLQFWRFPFSLDRCVGSSSPLYYKHRQGYIWHGIKTRC